MSAALLGEESVETLERIPMSYEDYLALPERPRHEWVDGVVVLTGAPTGPHQQAARRLANAVEAAWPDRYVVEAAAIRLPRNRERVPDVAVFEAEPDVWPAAQVPLVVAEVLSRSTRSEDLLRKGPEFAEGGIAHYWVVDADARTIEVHDNVDGRWQLVVVVDDAHPVAEVDVAGRGTVSLDVRDVLR